MSNFKLPIIILVEPQLGENIGSAARAMHNFNFEELRIVNPRDGWPNERALAMAANGESIIHNVKIFNRLEDSISDLDYLYATTTKRRDINKDYILVPDLEMKFNFNLKTGIMFGRENSGLTNQEISLANHIITINTHNSNSLNLAQAILIICYELNKSNKFTLNSTPPLSRTIINHQKIASKEELIFFINTLISNLEEKNFFGIKEKNEKAKVNITNIFSRIDKLNKNELKTLHGVIKALASV